MKSPKQRFQELDLAKSFLQIVHQEDFRRAVEYALLEFVDKQPPQGSVAGQTDNFTAAANSFRLEGARRVLDILCNLPLVPPPPQPNATRDNLEP